MRAGLARNSLWNVAGGLVPAIALLATVPIIVARLGDAHYGLLVLVTSIVGYFALVDLNVTAGTTKYVAEYHAAGRRELVHAAITFGVGAYAAIGVVGGVGIWLFAAPLATAVFSVPAAAQPTAIAALEWAALGFLLTQIQSHLAAIPQALERFDVSARLEMWFGVLVPIATVAVVVAGGGVVEIVMLRVVAAAANCVALVARIRRLLPDFRPRRPGAELVNRLLGFSAYAYLSRFASMTYSHADGLIIGALAGVAQLAYYSLPFTLTNRVLSITFRISQVVMPATSAMQARGELDRLVGPYLAYSRYTLYLNAFFAIALALFGAELLELWIGTDYAQDGAIIVTLIAAGMLVDSLTNLPSQVTDGVGRPKITGLFALGRALLGIALGLVLTRAFGITGAAAAHLIASTVMACAFIAYVHRGVFPVRFGAVARQAFAPVAICAVLAILAVFAMRALHGRSLVWSVVDACVYASTYAALGFAFVLDARHRSVLARTT